MSNYQIPTFTTERLILRSISEADFCNYEKHFVDYEVISELSASVPWPFPKGGVAKFLSEKVLPFQGQERWFWGIYEKENPNEVIGSIELWRECRPENRGFWLGRNFWGKGYMTEASRVIMDYAFEQLGFDTLIFSNALGNIKSRRVKVKTGARLLRTEPAKFVNSKYTEREIWELKKEIWSTFKSISTLNVIQDHAPEEFLKHSADIIFQDEAKNNLISGILNQAITDKTIFQSPYPFLFRVVDKAKTVAVAVQSNSMFNLVLSEASQPALNVLAAFLSSNGFKLPGVVGPQRCAEEFSRFWSMHCGQEAVLVCQQWIYKLQEVKMPSTKGEMRIAELSDYDLLTQWIIDFSEEALPKSDHRSRSQASEMAQKLIDKKSAYLWWVNQKPVAMTHAGRSSTNGVSIHAVYTPKEYRSQGFASVLVAQVSDLKIKEGKKFCSLYTDASNPTSNKIYQNIGYEQICESQHFSFVTTLSVR